MAGRGKKTEKFNVLEEIYNEKGKKQKSNGTIKDFFEDSKKVEWSLSAAILFLGLAALFFGVFQIKSKINLSLLAGGNTEEQTENINESDLLGLQKRDSDLDGLSDYDELYLYKSSPYLQDSDSDGVKDYDEVKMGEDPSCPSGQNCFANWGTGTDSGYDLPEADDLLYGGESVIDYVRTNMINMGMSPTEVNQYSDAEILEAYSQAVEQVNTNTSQQPTNEITISQQIEDLTPEDIRELLIQAGGDPNVVNLISDKELMDLVKETMAEEGLNTEDIQRYDENSDFQYIVSDSEDGLKIEDLTPYQIRQLMIQSGGDPEIVNLLSDEELMDLVEETLAEENN